jgi:predicted Zn finger-like uncharacterized protein
LIIQCEKCATIYHMDQALLEPFGSKVRCSRCGHIFRVNPSPLSEIPHPKDFQPVADPLLPSDQDQQEEESVVLPAVPNKKAVWGIGALIAMILLALAARFFYLQHLHPRWSSQDLLSAVFFLNPDPEGNQKISLINIKKYFKENQKVGRFFVVEGEVKNGYADIRQRVRIRGSLRMADDKVAANREIYAGWSFSPEELEDLSYDDINRLIVSQPERFSTGNRIPPGKTLPFMIVFPPLPPGSNQVSIEVVSSQKISS